MTPPSPELRRDLVAEISGTLDEYGHYQGDWFDSDDIFAVRVLIGSTGTPAWQINESTDQDTQNFGKTSTANPAPLTARYFQLEIVDGDASATFCAVIRVVDPE